MSRRGQAITLLSLAMVWPAHIVAAPAPASWTPPTLPDGQPDVQGFRSAGGLVEEGDRSVPTRGGTYSLSGGPFQGGGTDEVLKNRELAKEGKPLLAWPSKIIDPADSQIPYQPWARAKQKYTETNVDHPTKQEHLDPQERCFPDGPVRATFHYQFRIEQYPGYVVITNQNNHTYRWIPLDGRPHPAQAIKLWMSDSRGHWEGNTLVVDVSNSNSKSRLDRSGNFASDQVHIVERYSFNEPNSFEYRATLTDPTVYTEPWTLSAKLIRVQLDDPTYEQWEVECQEHEKNISELEKFFVGDDRPPKASDNR